MASLPSSHNFNRHHLYIFFASLSKLISILGPRASLTQPALALENRLQSDRWGSGYRKERQSHCFSVPKIIESPSVFNPNPFQGGIIMDKAAIERAKEHFGKIIEAQMQRMERVKSAPDWLDYGKVSPIKVGIIGGDGIGPFIAKDASRVLDFMLKDELKSGKVVINDIQGLTIERRAACNKPIPDDVLAEIKKYHVTLKGPTTTPRKGDP
jgi:hypothetical protein